MSRPLFGNIGIHARVMSAAVLLICATTLALGSVGVTLIEGFVTQRFSRQVNFMTRYLAMNSELGILIDEQNLLNGLATNLLGEEDICGVEILNRDGGVLVKEARDLPGPYGSVEESVYLTASDTNSPWLAETLTQGPRSVIGQVRVTYSKQGIEALTLKMTRRFIYSALVVTFLAGVMFYFISRSVVSPVISLAETARKISMGNREIRAEQGGTPEIAKLARAFNQMLDSMAESRRILVQAYEKMTRQEALAEVGKFSLMIAHEVKNPLAIIKSSLEMLKTDLSIPAENIPLSYAEEEIVRLNDLIEGFLMFSRPAKPRFEQVDLNRMAEQIMTGFDIQYGSGTMRLETRIPESAFMAEADFDLLSRAISNIVKNACEANQDQGLVLVEAKVRGSKWQLWVTDQGPGISEADQRQIFEPFFTTKAKGTGLGLAFADQVVKAHGGSIVLETGPGKGCCFAITLFSGVQGQEIESKEENGAFIDR